MPEPSELASDHTLQALYRRPGFLLRRAHQLSVGLFEERFRDVRLTPPQFGVLYVLSQCSVLDQTALARALGYDKVTTLRIVRGLQARELVTKQANPAHGRKVELRLTPAGSTLLHACREPAEGVAEQLLSALAPAEQETLIALLEKLAAVHEAKARAPMRPPF
jgi:MarR family transcriptional regulator, lower aerobic nicotinate degradation pathway regulator